MRKYKSLIGQRFDKLEVVEQVKSTARGQRQWLCKCDGTCITTTGNLNSGHTTNCGCKKSPDLTGKTFGKLEVLGRSDKRNPRGERTTPMWKCRCECGANGETTQEQKEIYEKILLIEKEIIEKQNFSVQIPTDETELYSLKRLNYIAKEM